MKPSGDPLVPVGSADSAFVQAPLANWDGALNHLVHREVRGRNSTGRAGFETVYWSSASGRHPWLEPFRRWVLDGVIHTPVSADSAVAVVRRQEDFTPTDSLRVTSGGGLHQRGLLGQHAAMVRFGVVNTTADPRDAYSALVALSNGLVPSPLRMGEIANVAWTAESLMPGQTVSAISLPLIEQVTEFLVGLPPGDGPISSVAEARSAVADACGAAVADEYERIGSELAAFPSVLSHGDLWHGNLLARGNNLTGIIDWDAWHGAGVPGADLVHLFAEARRRRSGESYGELVRQSFWNDQKEGAVLDAFFVRSGIAGDPAQLRSRVGRAWWAVTVANAMARNPSLRHNKRWMSRNVVEPARHIAARN